MKKILVYGDSNTWGDNFLVGKRIDDDKQWVNILQKKYKDKYIFLQEGLPGRIAGNFDKEKKYKNGASTFLSTYRTSAPIDILIISLGTNDLQKKYNRTKRNIIKDLLWYRKQVEELYADEENRKKFFKNEKMPIIIYIMPINFDYKVNASVIFDENSESIRQDIISYFKDKENIIVGNDMDLFDDGIHLSYKGHQQMAKLIESELEKYE